jgi:hypothetical protein
MARRILVKQGTPPTPTLLKQIEDYRLLDALDRMTPKPIIQQLARDFAEANKRLPRSQQRGAGGTNEFNLDRQIRRAVKRREAAMKRGTWWGPIPEDRIAKKR